MMLITEFEKVLQEEYDKDITIRINPNAEDIAGVYWGDVYLGVAVPPKEIHEEVSKSRIDRIGFPYKNISGAKVLVEDKLKKMKKLKEEDPELFKEM